MALGDIDGGFKGRRYGPVDRKETDESPEYQSKIDERTNPEDVEPANRFTVVDIAIENRKGQLDVPLRYRGSRLKVQGSGFKGSRFKG